MRTVKTRSDWADAQVDLSLCWAHRSFCWFYYAVAQFLFRCREENGYPYFLNLTSERYGWVPKMHEVPEDIRAK